MKNSTKILVAAAMGVAAGALVGLLFAPDKGKDTREKIAKKTGKVMKSVRGFDKEQLAKVREKLERKLQKVTEKMKRSSPGESSQA